MSKGSSLARRASILEGNRPNGPLYGFSDRPAADERPEVHLPGIDSVDQRSLERLPCREQRGELDELRAAALVGFLLGPSFGQRIPEHVDLGGPLYRLDLGLLEIVDGPRGPFDRHTKPYVLAPADFLNPLQHVHDQPHRDAEDYHNGSHLIGFSWVDPVTHPLTTTSPAGGIAVKNVGGHVLSLVVLQMGCASVIPQYEAAMERALAAPDPTPSRWVPDAVLHLSDDVVNEVVQAAIEDYGTFSSTWDLAIASFSPDMELSSMQIMAGHNCDDCLGIQIQLDGALKYTSLLGDGQTELAATGSLDAGFDISQNEEGDWTVSVQPRRFRFLDVTLGSLTVGVAGVSESVKDWIDRNLVTRVPPQQVMVIDKDDLPLADVEIVPDQETIQFHLLTMANQRGQVPVGGPRPESGWRMDISTESLVALARAEAFKAGPMALGIVSEPTMLSVDGDSFEMGLRLWRTEGRGWWRDYKVNGSVAVEQDEIRLTATDVTQTDKSPGAGLTDPLSALARGLILRYIEKAFETSMPAAQGEGTVVVIESISSEQGAIRASGSLDIAAPPEVPGTPAAEEG